MTDGYVRVVVSHWFGVLQVSLDGLQRSGVENFLSFLTVASAPSAQRLLVQNMNTQQEAVVHDLETLQDLKVRRKVDMRRETATLKSASHVWFDPNQFACSLGCVSLLFVYTAHVTSGPGEVCTLTTCR